MAAQNSHQYAAAPDARRMRDTRRVVFRQAPSATPPPFCCRRHRWHCSRWQRGAAVMARSRTAAGGAQA